MTDTRTIKTAFNNTARWHPDKEAFVQAFDEDRRYTYRESNRKARQFANGLANLGIEKGDRVGFLTETTAEQAIAYFAVSKLGAIPVIFHNREAPADIEKMTSQISPKILVFQPSFVEEANYLREHAQIHEFIALDELGPAPDFAIAQTSLLERHDATEPEVEIVPEDIAFINFTSGSTGDPDPIVHSHDEAIACAHHGSIYGGEVNDVFINVFSPAFIAWQNRIITSVVLGATSILDQSWDPEKVLKLIEHEQVTVLKLVPTQWKLLFEEDIDAYDTSSIRMAGYAGEAISVDLLKRIQEKFTENIRATYGTTEAMRATALFSDDLTEETLESVGKPLPNTEARLIRPGSKNPEATVDEDEIGELIIRGPTVAKQVWNNSERTRELFHEDGWWFSGDLAEVGPNNNIYIKGRADQMIISGGINIYPEKVENVLESHEQIVECAVIGVPHDRWGEAVKAIVVTSGDLTEEELDEWCQENDQLANFQRPREYEFVTDLPRTDTGKIARSELE